MSEKFVVVVYVLFLSIFAIGFWRGYLIGLRDGKIEALMEIVKEKAGE